MSEKVDYIDSSVYVALFMKQGDAPWYYLRLLGYKNKNSGLISTFVLGEVLNEILHSIRDGSPRLELAYKKRALEIIDKFVSDKEKKGVLDVYRITTPIKHTILEELMEVDRSLSYDDALHLTLAAQNDCENFVTTDKKIFESEYLRRHLKDSCGLKIKFIKISA